ncbi:MAG TPA: hypothetical protein VGR85_07720 [Candidatus Limnocylindria bacterium]|jgi:hypothetical protein|nr:hypothetical protein [Candidatus Limnocylindria bacterium]
MKDLSVGCAWVPSQLTISDAVVASIFVMSLPDGIAVRFTEYQGSSPGIRAWMRRWFEDRRDKYEREKRGELEEPIALISLSVQRAKPGGEYSLVESIAATSEATSIPDDWPDLPRAELLARAIAFLS